MASLCRCYLSDDHLCCRGSLQVPAHVGNCRLWDHFYYHFHRRRHWCSQLGSCECCFSLLLASLAGSSAGKLTGHGFRKWPHTNCCDSLDNLQLIVATSLHRRLIRRQRLRNFFHYASIARGYHVL